MHRLAKTAMLLAVILPLLASSVNSEIIRVARRYNVVSFFGGTSSPVGTYSNLAGFAVFTDELGNPIEVDGDKVYDPTYQLGFSYGRVRDNRLALEIGFRYTRIERTGSDWVVTGSDGNVAIVRLHQYDLDINFNYLLMNIIERRFAPYVGVGFRTGFTNAEAPGYRSEAHFNSVMVANVGAELKVWEGAKKRSFITLASVNSYDLYATGDRPRYMNIGGALKYYFRP